MKVDVYSKRLVAGDIFVTGSDGLFDMVSDSKILQIIENAEGNLEGVCEQLIAEANKNGGRDNITVLLSQVLS